MASKFLQVNLQYGIEKNRHKRQHFDRTDVQFTLKNAFKIVTNNFLKYLILCFRENKASGQKIGMKY